MTYFQIIFKLRLKHDLSLLELLFLSDLAIFSFLSSQLRMLLDQLLLLLFTLYRLLFLLFRQQLSPLFLFLPALFLLQLHFLLRRQLVEIFDLSSNGGSSVDDIFGHRFRWIRP